MYTQRIINLPDAPWHPKATIYQDTSVPARALLIYLHGGGLLYGVRDDLPERHREFMTSHGFVVIALDYPLAPAMKLPEILDEIRSEICYLLSPESSAAAASDIEPSSEISEVTGLPSEISEVTGLPSGISEITGLPSGLPWFLWGRSSGGYLALMTASQLTFHTQDGSVSDSASESEQSRSQLPYPPSGIISWYGYGMLTDGWADTPNAYYNTLHKAPASVLRHIPQAIHCDGPVMTHFLVYVYARQTGSWLSLIMPPEDSGSSAEDVLPRKASSSGSDEIPDSFTLRTTDSLPCPLFCTHATEDPDVPFAEFQALVAKYRPDKYITAGQVHDFDRDEGSWTTGKLLERTVKFIENQIE